MTCVQKTRAMISHYGGVERFAGRIGASEASVRSWWTYGTPAIWAREIEIMSRGKWKVVHISPQRRVIRQNGRSR